MSKIPIIDASIRKAVLFGALLIGVFALGVIGYHVIEGWSLFDALYMTVITMGTVGYGETHPLSDSGRLFTMFLIFIGGSVVLYAFTGITAFVVEGEMTGALRKRKMTKKIDQLDGHYILCGAGRTGMHVLREMQKTQRDCVVVECNHEIAESLIEEGTLVVKGDATRDTVLHAAGIDRAAGLLSALPTDRDNLFVVISARALNKTMRVVSKIDDIEAREKFLHSGADSGVSTNFIGGMRMASELVRPAAVGFLDTMLRAGGNLRVEEVTVGADSKYAGRTVGDLDVITQVGALMMSIQQSGAHKFNPSADTVIGAGDSLVLVGTPEQVSTLKAKIG